MERLSTQGQIQIMSITARCRCGKKYQVKNSAAGKKFKCTECGVPVSIPAEQLDDLNDFEDEEEEDEFDDGEIKMPVRRKKKKSSKTMSMAKGIAWEAGKEAPTVILKIIGIGVGSIGYLFVILYGVGAIFSLLTPRGIVQAPLLLFFAMPIFMGSRAALGGGLKVSRDNVWEGPGSVAAGIVLTIFGILLPVIIIYGAVLAFGR